MNNKEYFNEQVGKFCYSCEEKTYNQCLNCFNCGFCVDKHGNGKCIEGDHTGPYNGNICGMWYSGDPLTKMNQNNARN
jgi:hypothetical protein